MARDGQRGLVYAWEDAAVGPRDPSVVGFAQAQGFVNAVWAESGLRYPPAVEALRSRGRVVGRGNRLVISLGEATPSWCVLHEIAHAMSQDAMGPGAAPSAEEGDAAHGAVFMGLYIGLLAKYLRLDAAGLIASARAAGIKVRADARPVFID